MKGSDFVNKKGELAPYVALFLLSLVLLFAPVFLFINTSQKINAVESSISTSFSDEITFLSTNFYNDLKYNFDVQNVDMNKIKTTAFFSSELPKNTFKTLGFGLQPDNSFRNNSDIVLSNCKVTYKKVDNAIYFYLAYQIKIPCNFLICSYDYVSDNTAVVVLSNIR